MTYAMCGAEGCHRVTPQSAVARYGGSRRLTDKLRNGFQWRHQLWGTGAHAPPRLWKFMDMPNYNYTLIKTGHI